MWRSFIILFKLSATTVLCESGMLAGYKEINVLHIFVTYIYTKIQSFWYNVASKIVSGEYSNLKIWA